jgi:hypothetical protein
MNDVEITATCDGQVVYTKNNLTVLWVELSVRDIGVVSTDNEARENFKIYAYNLGDEYKLGGKYCKNGKVNPDTLAYYKRYGHAFEVKGIVYPNDFSDSIKITRDIEDWSQEGNTGVRKKDFSVDPDDANDPSNDMILDINPPTIYDLDLPSVNWDLLLSRNIAFYRAFNAYQWSIYDGKRCSSKIKFSILKELQFENNIEQKCWSQLFNNEHYIIQVLQNGTVIFEKK